MSFGELVNNSERVNGRLARLHRADARLSLIEASRLRNLMLSWICVHVEDELWDQALEGALTLMKQFGQVSK
jgi:hypothetical protein